MRREPGAPGAGRGAALQSAIGVDRELSVKTLFVRRTGSRYLFLSLCLASTILTVVETNTSVLKDLRAVLVTGVAPLYLFAESPYLLYDVVAGHVTRQVRLVQDRERLENEVLALKRIAGRYSGLVAENDRLRALLGSSARLPEDILVAEIVAVLPNPSRHEVVIDKGGLDSVEDGHAVVDSGGLMGQVIEAAAATSRVLLISDTTHALPVQVSRSNMRTIAVGTGTFNRLALEEVPVTADIVEGDLLLSSGLGGRFPSGYPVGVVTSVERNPADDFARVDVMPSAALDRTRHVLVVREAAE